MLAPAESLNGVEDILSERARAREEEREKKSDRGEEREEKRER